MELPRYTVEDLWIPDGLEGTMKTEKDQESNQEYCIYLGNRKYIDLDNHGEPMEVMGMQSALPFQTFNEADKFIREHWIDARVTEYYDRTETEIEGDD